MHSMEFGGQGVSEEPGYLLVRWLYVREVTALVWKLVDALSSFFFCHMVFLLLMDVDTPCYDT